MATEYIMLMVIIRLMVKAGGDPDPLQDICVADISRDISVNGYPCKSPSNVTVDDFIFHGLATSANTTNPFRSGGVLGAVEKFPGLNTLGLGIARLDLLKGGIVAPHSHPRASEIIYVVKGSLYAGFVTTRNKVYAKVINEGDVMVFPRGLLHWQLNVGNSSAMAIVSLNSQFPGFQITAKSLFGTEIMDEVLMKTFLLDAKTVGHLKRMFTT